VVRDLKVPHMFAGARIETQQRLGKKIRAFALAAVPIVAGRAYGL